MANIKLTPEVTSVLERSTITEKSVTLPPGQLDRKLYEGVKKALMLAGGKWSTPKQAFLFTVDPRGVLGIALNSGNIVDQKKLYQAFYTPPELAAQVVEIADVAGCRVLEPSAGDGALADACKAADCVIVNCVEIRDTAAAVLRSKGYLVEESDFLKLRPTMLYDRVVMNPPFTRGQDLEHVRHALRFLRSGGVLTSIILEGKAEDELHELFGLHEWELLDLGPDAFKAAGTRVKTSILTVRVRE